MEFPIASLWATTLTSSPSKQRKHEIFRILLNITTWRRRKVCVVVIVSQERGLASQLSLALMFVNKRDVIRTTRRLVLFISPISSDWLALAVTSTSKVHLHCGTLNWHMPVGEINKSPNYIRPYTHESAPIVFNYIVSFFVQMCHSEALTECVSRISTQWHSVGGYGG